LRTHLLLLRWVGTLELGKTTELCRRSKKSAMGSVAEDKAETRTLCTVLSFLAELSASLVLLLCLDETELVRKQT
jgi:hypothetical protein